jgi:hypothetical protein
MKHIPLTLGALWILLLTQGCSVYMAGNQPTKVDVASLESGGMSRELVIARLGVPVSSTKHEDGSRTDIYEFYAGSAKGWKVGRATFNAVADVFTLGLWEVIATPTEMVIKGDKISARADFDKNDMLKEFIVPKVEKSDKEDTPNKSVVEFQ